MPQKGALCTVRAVDIAHSWCLKALKHEYFSIIYMNGSGLCNDKRLSIQEKIKETKLNCWNDNMKNVPRMPGVGRFGLPWMVA